MTSAELHCADALEFLRSIPNNSVNLIATDPPYFRVKDEAWDRAWAKADEFIAWIEELAAEWRRVLTDNGTIYCFASPQMAARVQLAISKHLGILNEVVWVKESGRHRQAEKAALRHFFPQTERIIVAEQFGADGSVLRGSGYVAECQKLHAGVFEPLRQYLIGERDRAGVTNKQVDAHLGTNGMAGHYFGASQWALPTASHYAAMRELFNATGDEHLRRDYEDLRREYEDLRREYEDLRREYEDLRRPFSVTAAVPFTDVWTFPTVQARPGKHPCEKPLSLMRHIVETSSRPGDLVLDCFMGSGTTGVAALETGRRFVGCDMDARWVAYSQRRISQQTLPMNEEQAA